MIWIVWGSRLYGRVWVFARTHVATRFGHVWYFPLLPSGGSFLVVPLEGQGEGAIPIRLDLRSVLSVYVTAWGGLATLIAALAVGSDRFGALGGVGVVAVGAAVILFARKKLASMSLDERARRVAVNDVIAFPVDAARLDPSVSERFHAWVAPAVEKASRTVGLGYRVASGGEAFWREAAVNERTSDGDFLKGAFTLALLEISLKKVDPTIGGDLADRIWQRLGAVEPELFDRAATEDVVERKPCAIRAGMDPEEPIDLGNDLPPREAVPVLEETAPAETVPAETVPARAGWWPFPRPGRVPVPVSAAAYRLQGWKARGLGILALAAGTYAALAMDGPDMKDLLLQSCVALIGGGGLYLLAAGSAYDRVGRMRQSFKLGFLGMGAATGLFTFMWRVFQ
jgi:hypothetical protein